MLRNRESVTLREAARRLGDRAINVSGQHKDLLCERCDKMTEHISVSWADLADEAPIHELLGRVVFGKLKA